MRQTKKQDVQLYKIAPKLKVTTKGYINLITRNKVEVQGKRVKIYKSKSLLKVALITKKLHSKACKLFNQAFAQASILESNILTAKKALKSAKGRFLSTLEFFKLHCDLSRAYLHLQDFKTSLPNFIKVNLF
jgi:hypothetical protein